jgi:tetratricopeptide (TPR) repeat protein
VTKEQSIQFDPDNHIIRLCAEGMELELKQQFAEAGKLFAKAWDSATNDFEKFIAAHYVARHQDSVEDKLKWDETALAFALQINDTGMQANYPSLYLNIAKCYEDLNDISNAKNNYQIALSYSKYLPDSGYGQIVLTGIRNGIERLSGTH